LSTRTSNTRRLKTYRISDRLYKIETNVGVGLILSKIQIPYLVLFLLLFFSGLTYILYLQFMFPKLVPGYGGGERFYLNEFNQYTFQIPWTAYTRLHLSIQANDTITLYVNSEYICECAHYDLTIKPGEEALVMLRSESPVTGLFTARQEIPLERQLLAFTLLIIGLIGTMKSLRKNIET